MSYIYITLLSFFVSQTIKFLIKYFSDTKDSKNVLWVFIWATGAPSTHSTILVSNLVLLYKDLGASPVFMFSCVVSIIFMYNLIADRKHELIRGSNPQILDISGHAFFDIVCGILLGLVIGILFIQ